MFFGSDRGGETAAILMSILGGAKRHGIEPFEYVRQLLIALSSADVDLRSLLPELWITAHPEHFLQYRHDEAEAAARARKRRRAERRAKRSTGSPEAPALRQPQLGKRQSNAFCSGSSASLGPQLDGSGAATTT
jgi:hypothetical protein